MSNQQERSLWLKNYFPSPTATLRLFCFHPAGAGASFFRSWANHFSPQIEVFAIQLPGREDRLKESPFTQIAPLVRILAQVLPIDFLKQSPFAFFGHSLGALVSFELTRQLRRLHDVEPIHLLVSGRLPPHIYPNTFLYQQSDRVLIEVLRQYGSTPELVLQSDELMQIYLKILRSDFEINETYTFTPEPALGCPISAFMGIEDGVVSQEQLLQWSQHTQSNFEFKLFPGKHMYLKNQPEPLWKAILQSTVNSK
ncbi:alpha/beta fold hydrolase [Kamptonema animale CS-326]|jgi:medium-chain acyl-[acyl-carrier-protein] hydrolase|uniref:thioesterase II family protein n=1 Tax=Kamptonema animale TaxID=92934 RepID=UPI00232B1830|nr:alpha/beta fold hydrolase [Kamptonema animale]MDB9509705.1 alpha/beta fold hydrolase [Kamptonema animale CS-326]